MQHNYDSTALFLSTAIRDICGVDPSPQTRVMDFGCGAGKLVRGLLQLGYDTYGCDLSPTWTVQAAPPENRLSKISRVPYRLPYDDNSFDVVVSTSVLEHAQNKKTCFREIHRVLKSGGHSIHLFPGKWYLPYEPHIHVPLVNWLWPRCPKWWLAWWSFLGVRNEYQKGMSWKEVRDANLRYCRRGLSYWSGRKYRDLALEVFGNHAVPMDFYIEHGSGGAAALARRLPFKEISGWFLAQARMTFIVQHKSP